MSDIEPERPSRPDEPAAQVPPAKPRSRRRRLRRWTALVLVVISIVALVVSGVALWSHDLLFDTDSYVQMIGPIAEDPAVQHSVAVFAADKAVAASDLETRLEQALPGRTKLLAGALTLQVRDFIVKQVEKFLGTEAAQRLWVGINRFTHEQLVKALRDENAALTINENDVTLNLIPIVSVALQKLDERLPDIRGRDIPVPQIDPSTTPEQARQTLEGVLGRQLPADFGTITLLRGDQGAQAKQAVHLFDTLVVVVVIVTVLLIVAAVLVSPRRLVTAFELGLGLVLAFVLSRVVENRLEDAIVNGIKTEGGVAVGRSLLSSAIDSLNGFLIWLLASGIVLAVAAVLALKPHWLAAVGRWIDKLFGVAADLTAPHTAASRWMARHLDVLRAGGVVVAIIILLFVLGSLTAAIVVLACLAVYELALAAFAAAVAGDGDEEATRS